jgi:hypothetical protein
MVVDQRAGHGPGIGGFKADRGLGLAMRAGHRASSWVHPDLPD